MAWGDAKQEAMLLLKSRRLTLCLVAILRHLRLSACQAWPCTHLFNLYKNQSVQTELILRRVKCRTASWSSAAPGNFTLMTRHCFTAFLIWIKQTRFDVLSTVAALKRVQHFHCGLVEASLHGRRSKHAVSSSLIKFRLFSFLPTGVATWHPNQYAVRGPKAVSVQDA